MTSQVSEQELGDAILQSVEHGTFPQSEHVASAEVPATALPKLLEVLSKAREDTKNEIRTLSREAASDVDGWISQARKLQDDIKRSQETAQEIVQQAESGKETTARVQDATSKVSFLYSEMAYNESLVQVVEQIRDISTLLEAVQDAAVRGNVMHALERLEDVGGAFKQLGTFQDIRVVAVLKTRADQLRSAIVEHTTDSWNSLIAIDSTDRHVVLKNTLERETTVDINTIVEALAKLGLLDTFISRLSRDFDKVIMWPRLTIGTDRMVSALEVDGDKIRVDGHVSDMSIEATLSAIQTVAEYLSTRLPHSIALPLSEKLVPTIASRLISNWLLPAIPLTVKGVPQFQETLSLVLGSAEFFDELGWSGQNRLREWVDKSAEIWLARRKQDAIARMHSLLPRRVREKKPVERVETQMVSHGDVLGRHEQEEDDWGADWENEEDHAAKDAPPPEEEVEEEDMSAWDDGDDAQEDAKGEPKPDRTAQHEEEDSDAWAWGDEDQPQTDVPQVPSKPKQGQPHSKEKAAAPQKSTVEKEVTLRETYTVTAVPDAIMEIILQVISDVGALNQPDLVASVIAPAAGGLYAIPSLLMAMYRATAASHYSKDVAGDMLIYNDCTRLADRLRSFLKERTELDQTSTLPQHLRPTARLRFDEDIKSIEGFGKRAYGREMESQRTIIKDHLGGAQSFQSCTAAPFAAECDNAIAMTIDRIGEVKRQWQNILSPSVLLQSLGSLVSTAISTFISDVEDMTDIAEDESRKLHSYCVSLSSLSSLFQQQDDSGAVQDMVSIYTPNWFKLQYLGEVLDSSLADIRYFWTNGELKLEMEAEEVVDLIKALFAESEHRRKAIAEIRRTSMH